MHIGWIYTQNLIQEANWRRRDNQFQAFRFTVRDDRPGELWILREHLYESVSQVRRGSIKVTPIEGNRGGALLFRDRAGRFKLRVSQRRC